MISTDFLRLARAEAVARKQRAESEEGLMESLTAATEAGDAETAAEAARKIRNKLLELSDKEMALDRAGIDLPDKVTAVNSLATVSELVAGLKKQLGGAWAAYRQALRDIPEQPGFPFGIEWPKAPDENVKPEG